MLKRLLLAALLAATSLPVLAQTSLSPERELLQRAVAPFWGPASLQASVLVRQVPADLGLALPRGSRIVGSVATQTTDPQFPAGVTVYFDTALTPEQVNAYFARVLVQAGWKVFPVPNDDPFSSGGFQTTVPPGGPGYSRENPDQLLNVRSRVVGGVTQVSLSRERSPNLKQQLRYAQLGRAGGPINQLPKLFPPAGSTVTPRGEGGSGDSITQSAGIESTLSRAALFEHYAAQLRGAGWTLRNRADTGTLTTTLWTFPQDGQERVGLLILGEAARGQYRATLGTQGLE